MNKNIKEEKFNTGDAVVSIVCLAGLLISLLWFRHNWNHAIISSPYPPITTAAHAGATVDADTMSEAALHWPFAIIEPEPEPEPRVRIEQKPEPRVRREPEPPPVRQESALPLVVELRLESPVRGTELLGLTASRQPTIFRWSADKEVGKSRFILSRNPDLLRGQPEVEISNPNRSITVERLGEGVWYWTVEAWTPDGIRISAAEPNQLRVLPVPLLPEAGNRQPANGQHIKRSELRDIMARGGLALNWSEASELQNIWAQEGLEFSWAAVNGATAYIVTLFHETNNERKQIVQTDPLVQTKWILRDITILERGTFVWQVEAVNRNRSGVIDQRGRMGENIFIVEDL